MRALRLAMAAILMAAAGSVAAQPEGGQATEGQAVAEAAAAVQPTANQAPAAQATADRDKRICKTEKMTGSLTRVRRTCMTQREWSRLAEGSSDFVVDLERDMARAHAIPQGPPMMGGN